MEFRVRVWNIYQYNFSLLFNTGNCIQYPVINHNGREKKVVLDSTLQLTFKKPPLVEFWCSIKEEHPELFGKAVELLFFFRSTYLNEAGFSSYTSAKTTYCNIECKSTFENPAL